MKCRKGFEIKVLSNTAGYYFGAVDECGLPNCRITDYFKHNTPDSALRTTMRDCIENQYCNDGLDCFASDE